MTSDTEQKLDSLLCKLTDGTIDHAEKADFERLLKTDEDAREHYYLYMTLNGLLMRRFSPGKPDAKDAAISPAPANNRFIRLILLAAASLMIGLIVWRMSGPVDDPKPSQPEPVEPVVHGDGPMPALVEQVGGWQYEYRDADVQQLSPGVLRLERGEIFVKSLPLESVDDPRVPLKVETPNGTATASGTEFYVGIHKEKSKQENDMNAITRVLVLSGAVVLTNPLGTVSGGENDLLVAKKDEAPVKLTVKANADFAIDLYKQLAKGKGKNVFFSPYSISSALAMVAEGARGETAAEMGNVLRYPDAAKRIGDDAQLIPWRTALINSGFQQINAGINDKANDPKAAVKQARIQELRAELKKTKAQTQKAAHWRDKEKLVRKERKIIEELNPLLQQVDQYKLSVANALWGEKTFHFEKPYLDTIGKFYDSGAVKAADFRGDFEGERKRINAWVEDKTEKRIKDLLPPNSLDDLTRLVLVNAIYFNGRWQEPFAPSKTKEAPFHLANGKTVNTSTMHADYYNAVRYGAFNADGSFFQTPSAVVRRSTPLSTYPKKGGFSMVEIPYRGKEVSMVVIAPLEHDGLPAVEAKLSSKSLADWLGILEKRSTHIRLPKFKVEADYQLHETLPLMGMRRAFIDPRLPEGADFTGIHDTEVKADRLYVSKVLHKAFVEVSEEGTEAAAATAVVMPKPNSAPMRMPFFPTFKADRPFICIIRHKATGTILFMGRIENPAEQ